jgi:hypothetical protein|tara:strand:+ start:395 stop:691 length:297 start_codon:yes stop_codon:yes gene_type:complete
MSSELNTKTTENAPQVPSIFINGKEYKQDKLSADCLNAIAVRQDLQANRMRHVVEVEKIDVLTKHYDAKIEKELEKVDGPKTEEASNVATANSADTAK